MSAGAGRGARGTALVAIGGNALVLDGEAASIDLQLERAAQFAATVAELVADGWSVVVTHGNGPQVGFILRRGELVAPDATLEGLPALPLWLAVADSQGGIGHMLTVAIDTALLGRGLSTHAVAVLTHAEVDRSDPAFARPTKPIGGQMTPETARRRATEEGWAIVETDPGHFRRVVASPIPHHIVESPAIDTLLGAGSVVVAAGGGGIPVVRDETGWHPIDAVIDKDRASALLASQIQIDTLVLVTGVDQVYVDFGTPDARPLDRVGVDELRSHLEAGQFPAGSMGPKIQSAIEFVENGGSRAIITSLGCLHKAIAGTAGTQLEAAGVRP
jgi:carbamate kinase